MPSAHIDSFARDHLPSREAQPEYLFALPTLQFPQRLNCATELLDRAVAEGRGDRLCIQAPMLLNELFLGVWLIVKGFNPSAVAALSATQS